MEIEFNRPNEGGLRFRDLQHGKMYKSLSTASQPHYGYTRERDVVFALGVDGELVYFNKKTGNFGPCTDDAYNREPYFELPTGTTVTLTSK